MGWLEMDSSLGCECWCQLMPNVVDEEEPPGDWEKGVDIAGKDV